MKTILCSIALILGALGVSSQDTQPVETKSEEAKAEETAVRATLQLYLDGYSKGDVPKLKQAFRQDVVIKYISPWNGKYSEFTMPQLNEFMEKLPVNWDVAGSIDSVDVHGHAAAAKVTAKVKGMVTWTDYIQLLKIEGRWWIIGKVSAGDLPDSR